MGNMVFLVRTKEGGGLLSIWTTYAMAQAAVILYDSQNGPGKVRVEEWQLNVSFKQPG